MSAYHDLRMRQAPDRMCRLSEHIDAFFDLVRVAHRLTEGELRSRLAELAVTGTVRHDVAEATEAVFEMEAWMRFVDRRAVAAAALADLPADYPLVTVMSGPPPDDDDEDALQPHPVGVMTASDVAFELARGGYGPDDVMYILRSRSALRPAIGAAS